MGRKRKPRPNYNAARYWQTEAYNQALYQTLRDDILQLALSRYKWLNLPATCDAWYLEWTLVHQGIATIAHPAGKPHITLSLQAVQQGQPNMYSRPKRWNALGANGLTRFPVDARNGVVIFDNKTRFPLIRKIDLWARELADIIRTKQINRYHLRTPFVISGTQERQFDMQNLAKQIAQGEPIVIGTDGMSNIDVRVWETKTEFFGKDLQEEFENTWNNVYRMLGIRNLPFKAERRIEDEVLADAQPSELSALASLECRREIEKYNDRFGTDIKVVLNSDIETHNYETLADLERYAALMDGDNDDSRI